MLLHYMNDNILISHPSYLGVYQYEAKNESFTKISIFGVGTKSPEKTGETSVQVTVAIIIIWKAIHWILKGGWVYWDK